MDSMNILSASLSLELLAGFASCKIVNSGLSTVIRALDFCQKVRRSPCRFSVFVNVFSFGLRQYLLFKSKEVYSLLVIRIFMLIFRNLV